MFCEEGLGVVVGGALPGSASWGHVARPLHSHRTLDPGAPLDSLPWVLRTRLQSLRTLRVSGGICRDPAWGQASGALAGPPDGNLGPGLRWGLHCGEAHHWLLFPAKVWFYVAPDFLGHRGNVVQRRAVWPPASREAVLAERGVFPWLLEGRLGQKQREKGWILLL